MDRLKAYLELVRYPLFAIPIVATLPGALIASQGKLTWRVAIALVIALFGYFAGMIKNDYFHHETDKQTNPERPLPSQRLTPRQAIIPASCYLRIMCHRWFPAQSANRFSGNGVGRDFASLQRYF